MKVEDYCNALDEWAKLFGQAEINSGVVEPSEFMRAWRSVRFAIDKSCLLSRTMYCGEKPSQTPCPVHKGRWSGINFGWPGAKYSDGRPAEESKLCREYYDKGCRCYQHKCGCTTGWQPDEHCGCLEKTEEVLDT